MTKDIKQKPKSKLHPAILGILAIGLIIFLLSRWLSIDIRVESGVEPGGTPSPLSPAQRDALLAPEAEPTTPTLNPAQANSPIAQGTQATLRVSNQTKHPIRVALLPQSTPAPASPPATAPNASYSQPAHWDFAPQEGRTKGLILSLPSNQKLQLQPGDVVVAFAQDGSQRYWGPYVVGQTASPAWNANTQEWWLILQP
ncbi:MAG: hypothetical protein MUF49_10905 [Oculatellaceae cyanobacterium Prado106]|nr:hypothetical protein [Oculatellaceae cyanobacterium Prado106]